MPLTDLHGGGDLAEPPVVEAGHIGRASHTQATPAVVVIFPEDSRHASWHTDGADKVIELQGGQGKNVCWSAAPAVRGWVR